MANYGSFQSQISAIMDVLAKAAVAEISQLVEEDAVVLRLEVRRKEEEIEGLKNLLETTERELRKLQTAVRSSDKSSDKCSVGVQVESPRRRERDVLDCVRGPPFASHLWANSDTNVIPELVEEKPLDTNSEEQNTHLIQTEGFNTHLTSTEELTKHQKPEFSQGALVGVGFEMKVEQMEELSQSISYSSTGDLNHLDTDSQNGMDERDSQLWSSIAAEVNCGKEDGDPACSDGAVQHTPVFPSHSELYSTPHLIKDARNCESAKALLFGSAVVKVEDEAHCEGDPMASQAESTQQEDVLHHGMKEAAARQAHDQHYGTSHTPVRAAHAGHTHPLTAAPYALSNSHAFATSHTQAPVAEGSFANKNIFRPRQQMVRIIDEGSRRLFVCSACGKSFFRLRQLEVHERGHAGVKPYRCGECGKRFTQKTRLKTHQRIHTGEKPFSCGLCGKKFSRQDNCTRHERLHSGQRPYSCQQCGKSFPVLSILELHMQLHS